MARRSPGKLPGLRHEIPDELQHRARTGRTGRILRKTAYVSFLPSLITGFFLPGIAPDLYEGLAGNRGFWLFFGIMFIPPLLLAVLSVAMPTSRHLVCKKCGWNRDYKALPAPTSGADTGKPESETTYFFLISCQWFLPTIIAWKMNPKRLSGKAAPLSG